MRQSKCLELIAHGGQLLAFPRRDIGRIHLSILIFECRPVSHLLVVLRKRKGKRRHMIRRAEFLDGLCRGIQPEEVRVGLLLGGEINPIRSPADEPRIFIEAFRQNLRRPSFRGYHGDLRVRVVVIFRSRRCIERNLFSIG